jgi:hypothetical protein
MNTKFGKFKVILFQVIFKGVSQYLLVSVMTDDKQLTNNLPCIKKEFQLQYIFGLHLDHNPTGLKSEICTLITIW